MLADLRGGIWSELSAGSVTIDGFRRELQRSYLVQALGKLNPVAPQLPPGFPAEFLAQLAAARSTSDVQSAFRADLKALEGSIRQALGRVSDRATRAHLEDGLVQIDRILNPNK